MAIGYAGGGITSVDGELKIAAHLRAGETLIRFPISEFQAIGIELNETTLIDSRRADVHLFLRSHGEKVTGLVGEALHTFNGACVYDPPIVGSEPDYGVPGPNICQDQFFAIFSSEEAN